MIFSPPIAFVLGILGIILDKKKWLAVVTTIIAALLIVWYVVVFLNTNQIPPLTFILDGNEYNFCLSSALRV